MLTRTVVLINLSRLPACLAAVSRTGLRQSDRVFANRAHLGKSKRFLHPDTPSCSQLTSCNLTNVWLRSSFYRDTAPAGLIDSDTLPYYRLSISCVPRYAYCPQTLQLDGKNTRHACPTDVSQAGFVRLRPTSHPRNNREILFPGLRSLTNTHIIIPLGRYAAWVATDFD